MKQTSLIVNVGSAAYNGFLEKIKKQPDVSAVLHSIMKHHPPTKAHVEGVASLNLIVAHHLGFSVGKHSDILAIFTEAGFEHDDGKRGIPDYLLSKAGKLDDKEFRIVREHALLGYRYQNSLEEQTRAVIVGKFAALLHHSFSGKEYALDVFAEIIDKDTSYQQFMSRDQLELLGQVTAITDAFCCATESRKIRPWKDPSPTDVALEGMKKWLTMPEKTLTEVLSIIRSVSRDFTVVNGAVVRYDRCLAKLGTFKDCLV